MCAIFAAIKLTVTFEVLSSIYNLSGSFVGTVGGSVVDDTHRVQSQDANARLIGR